MKTFVRSCATQSVSWKEEWLNSMISDLSAEVAEVSRMSRSLAKLYSHLSHRVRYSCLLCSGIIWSVVAKLPSIGDITVQQASECAGNSSGGHPLPQNVRGYLWLFHSQLLVGFISDVWAIAVKLAQGSLVVLWLSPIGKPQEGEWLKNVTDL